jgi:predicted RNase H-like HicB family nuclease
MSKQNFMYKLPVSVIKQNKSFVAYCPVLDISTVGKSVKDAQNNFAELAGIFFDELTEKGTLNDVLSELGWKKAQKSWNPPKIVSNLSVGIRLPSVA